jgi:hypothetical protein
MTTDPAGIIREFEARVREIVGERVAGVQYRELDFGDGEPHWANRDFDSVDFGIELRTESGELFSIKWEGTSFLGLIFYKGSLDSELVGGREGIWDVTQTSRWRDNVGRSITKSHVYWGHGETPDGVYVPAPDCISLEFDSGDTVHIQYGEYSEDTRSLELGDNVTVFFDDATARLYRAGPYTPDALKYPYRDQ